MERISDDLIYFCKVSALRKLFSNNREFLDYFIYKDELIGSEVSSLVFCSPEVMDMETRLLFQAGMDIAYEGGGLFLTSALRYWSNRSWSSFLNAIETLKNLNNETSSFVNRDMVRKLEDLF